MFSMSADDLFQTKVQFYQIHHSDCYVDSFWKLFIRFFQSEAEEHTVVGAGQVAEGLQGGVAALAGEVGEQLQQLVGIEEQIHVAGGAVHLGVQPDDFGDFQVHFLCRGVVRIGTVHGFAAGIGRKSAVGIEGERQLARLDADLVQLLVQFLLESRGGQGATCLLQEVVRFEFQGRAGESPSTGHVDVAVVGDGIDHLFDIFLVQQVFQGLRMDAGRQDQRNDEDVFPDVSVHILFSFRV